MHLLDLMEAIENSIKKNICNHLNPINYTESSLKYVGFAKLHSYYRCEVCYGIFIISPGKHPVNAWE